MDNGGQEAGMPANVQLMVYTNDQRAIPSHPAANVGHKNAATYTQQQHSVTRAHIPVTVVVVFWRLSIHWREGTFELRGDVSRRRRM